VEVEAASGAAETQTPTAVTPAPAPTPALQAPAAANAAPVASPTAARNPAQAAQANRAVGATAQTDLTDSVLAGAGYPLTPGVSALPVRSEFALSGYAQAQYESHQDSVDQLRQGGVALNQNRFLVRRGRIKLMRDWDYAQVILEVDGNTTRGPTMRLQKAEASLIYGRSKDKDQPPLAQLTLGQFDLPFGFEMTYVPKVRWFMERTTASRALWPSEPDLGVRFSGGLGFARYSVAVTNGEPLDEKTGFPLQDPNANKDITARLGAESKINRSVVLAGGVSFNRGKGFSPGTDSTKSMVAFQDHNENGNVDNIGELTGQGASAAKRSQNFSRWAVGADAELLFKTDLGWSMLYAELVAASNLDRGLVIADPVLNHGAIRELGYYIALTQEVTQYGVAGFRYEFYDPNADFTDTRAGKLLPASQQVRTLSPLLGLVLPGRARLTFEWDIVRDYFARDSRGVPADLKNDQWTVRLQGVM
jgi:hypothetical protein